MPKLKINNDWGKLSFFIDNEKVDGILHTITLRFPDKTSRTFNVKWVSHSELVSDHGQQD